MNLSGPEWEAAVLEAARRSCEDQMETLRKAKELGNKDEQPPEEESH